ncbi:MAG: biopolymer transporter ExbD [Phycisphaerae bacterium]|nr:biopolymer transporter ExbD [Phycisphaerae bacterium]
MLSVRKTKLRRQALILSMAPMVDVVFLLLIFFALVTRFASAENVQMDLPKPEHSAAQNVQLKDRVVINCRLADPGDIGAGVLYSVGPYPPESLERISARLVVAKKAVEDLKVVIRADRRLPFAAVRVVMQVVAENRIEMMNLVAHVGEGE